MAARLPGLSALLLAAGVQAASLSAQAVDTAAAVRSVGAETIRRSGATGLGELLLLAGGWHVATVDGFTWDAAPPGGSPFQPARWIVLVDGRRVDVDLFGSLDLDRVGVPLERVERVEFHELPRLVGGRLTTEGIVLIHTADPRPGVSANGWFATGSEIGDPGPFAFTPEAGENVDRIGHDASVSLAYGGASWSAAAALGSSERIPSDPAIAGRYSGGPGTRLRLDATTASAEVGLGALGGRHRLAIRHSNLGGAVGLSPFGREITTRERFTQLGLAGAIGAPLGRGLSYDVGHSRDRVRPRGPAADPAVERERRSTEAWVELGRRRSGLATAGIRLRRLALESPPESSDPTVTLASGYVEVGLGGERRAATVLSAAVTGGEGDLGLAASLERTSSPTPGSTLRGLVAYERITPAEDSVWGWSERGYPLLDDVGVDLAVVGTGGAPWRLTADAQWLSRPAARVGLRVRGLFRRERNLTHERQRLHYLPESESFEGPLTLVRGSGGEVAGATLDLDVQPIAALTARLSYWYSEAVGGDPAYRESRAVVPRHGARLASEYEPVAGLALWLAVAYRSASRWAAFEAVEAESAGRYRAELPAKATIDLAIQKWLWAHRLRAHFGVRNVLGADLRHHPAGAVFAPAAVVRIEGRLPSLR